MTASGKVLLLSWRVPPKVAGSAVVARNLASQFTADEMVVAGMYSTDSPPLTWEDEWPDLIYIASESSGSLSCRRLGRFLLLPVMLLRVLRITRRHQIDTLLVFFPDEVFLLLGYLVSLLTGARLFPHFHNTYLENRSGILLRLAKWLQPRVFARSEHVFVMSEGMVEVYKKRYPDIPCSALIHSFHQSIPEYVPPPEPTSPFHFTITGRISESCRDAAVRVADAIDAVGDGELTLITASDEAYLRKIGLLREGVTRVTVADDEFMDWVRRADILVLPNGLTGERPEDEYMTMFPTRTIEYLISGRPILAHSPEGSFLNRWLRKHDCALIVSEPCAKAVCEAIEQLRGDAELRNRLVCNALKAAEQFHAPRVAENLRLFLDNLHQV